jgi:mono/diheme cytochrome c family protein
MPRAFAVIATLLVFGCRQDMARQPSVRPLRPTPFFSDGPSQQQPVRGTVARGQLEDDDHLYRGKKSGQHLEAPSVATMVALANPLSARFAGAPAAALAAVDSARNRDVREFPFAVTETVLKRGRVQYDVFCAVCHDAAGTGTGMIVRRGYTRPPSYHVPRLRQAPVGYLFDVATNGFGAMPDYASQIDVADRWAIVAYLRVLQRSQHARLDDVPAEARAQLNGARQ